ncbi:MAG TPA: PepSY domain-containing protein [Verrucomicrobiae bacterium]|nr:PepSY domain-containing protein [Verrucomicrobiae bacterium]
MNIKFFVSSALAIVLLAGCATEKHKHHDKEAKLQAEAKVSKEDATRIALAQVPNGTVKDAELEKEHGKLIWSFDVATPGSKDITEVNVDAINGKVVSTDKESPEKESKEANKKKEKD